MFSFIGINGKKNVLDFTHEEQEAQKPLKSENLAKYLSLDCAFQ